MSIRDEGGHAAADPGVTSRTRAGALRTASAFALLLLLAATGPAARAQAAAPDTPIESRPSEPLAARAVVPEVDVYFPEGDLDLKLQRLIKNAFVQGQVRYNFVKGDIFSSLRYRYYGHERIWQIGVFDELNFDRLEERSNDFQRVRGGLVRVELPDGSTRRAFFLAEVDSLTSNKVEQLFSTDRTDTFLRVGYQIGTPDDSRSNAIVGESRSRIESLFTAHRRIGPSGFGLTGALSWSFDELGGDFSYLRAEIQGLKRWSLGDDFLVGRIQAGHFLDRELSRPNESLPQNRYSIPLDELFRLDGREALKGLDRRVRGTEILLLTAEWFVPWFELDARKRLGAAWETWYWVGYLGVGGTSFENELWRGEVDPIVDVGAGFESALRVGNYRFFLAAVVAHALDQGGDVEARLTIKSSR